MECPPEETRGGFACGFVLAESELRFEMAWDLILWVLIFFLNFALLASTFYQLLCLSDLEADYINPYDTASRINALVVPEMVVQIAVCVIFLLTWHWFMFLITLPLACYHVMLYTKKQHLIDVTEVFRFLNGEKKYRMIKLGFYLIFFLIIIFRLMLSIFDALTEEDTHVW